MLSGVPRTIVRTVPRAVIYASVQGGIPGCVAQISMGLARVLKPECATSENGSNSEN